MESFVEDLLNLRLIKEGVFKIQKGVFNAYDAFDFVIDIFKPKADEKLVNISWEVVKAEQQHHQASSKSDSHIQ